METILFQVISKIVIPELAKFIQDKYNSTGTWPTVEEMEAKAASIADDINKTGQAFLDRPKDE